jgi:LysR family transcriptional regulator, benzoate and cis,cis-muconate-responsive activator of ben and cat genes
MRYPHVDMEGLTAIVTLAETCDMTKAGELLHVGPSAVVKRLSKAENELLTKFFRKSKNRVVLTTDGKIYCSEAALALEHAVLAEEKLVAAKRLHERHLLVGHSAHLPAKILSLLAHLNTEGMPGIKIEQTGGLDSDIEQAVEKSLLHVGISFLPVDQSGLCVHPLLEEPIVLCMKAGHELATKLEIRPEDLEGQPVIAVARQALPALHEEIAEFLGGFGLELNVVADAYTPSEALCLVERQIGVCFLSRSSAMLGRSVVTKPLFTNVLTRKCGIFYREGNAHPLIRKFVALISERTAQARL